MGGGTLGVRVGGRLREGRLREGRLSGVGARCVGARGESRHLIVAVVGAGARRGSRAAALIGEMSVRARGAARGEWVLRERDGALMLLDEGRPRHRSAASEGTIGEREGRERSGRAHK